MRGHSVATATDGGGGASHACAVSGSLRTDIHFGQLLFGSPSSSNSFALLGFAAGAEVKLKVSFEIPILRMASFVVKLVVRSLNILAGCSSLSLCKARVLQSQSQAVTKVEMLR
jgi:hypothetical protein